MTTRRSFLKAILAASAAPYVVTSAGVLMPVRAPILTLYGDGLHDDTAAVNAWLAGKRVHFATPSMNCGSRIQGANLLLASGPAAITRADRGMHGCTLIVPGSFDSAMRSLPPILDTDYVINLGLDGRARIDIGRRA